MNQFLIRKYLPNQLKAPLWGDRKRWGLETDTSDHCWKEWQDTYTNFYQANQRQGVGQRVNDAGYEIMKSVDLSEKTVLEYGAGDIRHHLFWQGTPKEYFLADVSHKMMSYAEERLSVLGIDTSSFLLPRNQNLPLDDNSVDIIISFYSLEHLYPLDSYLLEMKRLLKPGGILVGAIPSEGGLAWGVGRMLTSRRWFKKNTSIDPDKIICWEHPNFADEIVSSLNEYFEVKKIESWPLSFLSFYDLNLVVRFICEKPPEG